MSELEDASLCRKRRDISMVVRAQEEEQRVLQRKDRKMDKLNKLRIEAAGKPNEAGVVDSGNIDDLYGDYVY